MPVKLFALVDNHGHSVWPDGCSLSVPAQLVNKAPLFGGVQARCALPPPHPQAIEILGVLYRFSWLFSLVLFDNSLPLEYVVFPVRHPSVPDLARFLQAQPTQHQQQRHVDRYCALLTSRLQSQHVDTPWGAVGNFFALVHPEEAGTLSRDLWGMGQPPAGQTFAEATLRLLAPARSPPPVNGEIGGAHQGTQFVPAEAVIFRCADGYMVLAASKSDHNLLEPLAPAPLHTMPHQLAQRQPWHAPTASVQHDSHAPAAAAAPAHADVQHYTATGLHSPSSSYPPYTHSSYHQGYTFARPDMQPQTPAHYASYPGTPLLYPPPTPTHDFWTDRALSWQPRPAHIGSTDMSVSLGTTYAAAPPPLPQYLPGTTARPIQPYVHTYPPPLPPSTSPTVMYSHIPYPYSSTSPQPSTPTPTSPMSSRQQHLQQLPRREIAAQRTRLAEQILFQPVTETSIAPIPTVLAPRTESGRLSSPTTAPARSEQPAQSSQSSGKTSSPTSSRRYSPSDQTATALAMLDATAFFSAASTSSSASATNSQPVVRQCQFCQTTSTPEWRNLCNACGLRYARERQKHAQLDLEIRKVHGDRGARQLS
ncbi:hypothetical protein RI367_003580 [Sorochytrium milnesiophthora]